MANERLVRMADGRVIGVRSGPLRGRRDESGTHSCMVVGEETTAVREAQPRNSSGSLTSQRFGSLDTLSGLGLVSSGPAGKMKDW